jgi:uncharacterized lipoprotein YbaY/heat shock protein HslJ
MKRYAIGLIAAVFAIVAGSVSAQNARITGTIMVRERIALTPRAAVEVTLEDVSRADVTATVVARMRLESPGQAPIGFELPYDASRIDARRRYALRAQIFEDDRLVFSTAQPTFVLTQGRGAQATLMLTPVAGTADRAGAAEAVPPPSAAAGAVMSSTAARTPAGELRNLPATFTGTAAGTRYQLNLFPDESYFLRIAPLSGRDAGQDDIGSWTLSSDRRVLVLRGSRQTTEMFTIQDQGTLRGLPLDASPPAAGAGVELRRLSTFTPFDVRLTVTGMYQPVGESGQFTECLTGQQWPASPGEALRAVGTSRRQTVGRESSGVLVTVEGALITRRGPLGAPGGRQWLQVDRVVRTDPQGRCEPRFAATPLTNTIWRLTRLGTEAVTIAPGTRGATLTFRETPRSFSASGGCNRIAGSYQITGDSIGLRSVGTLTACPNGGGLDQRLRAALNDARSYRVMGPVLELYDARRQLVARFESGEAQKSSEF